MISNKAIFTTVTVPSTGEAKCQGLVKALSQLELRKALYKAFGVKKTPTVPAPIVISKATVAPPQKPTEPHQKLECFHCHLKGHYARNCHTQKKAKKAAAAAILAIIKATITPVTNNNKYKSLEEKEDGPTSRPTSSPTLSSLPLNSLRRPVLGSALDQASPPSHSPIQSQNSDIIKKAIMAYTATMQPEIHKQLAEYVRSTLKKTPQLPTASQITPAIQKLTHQALTMEQKKPDAPNTLPTINRMTLMALEHDARLEALDQLCPKSMWGTPKYRALLESMEIDLVQVKKRNVVTLEFTIQHYRGQNEETALLDTGATESFVDNKTIERLKLGTQKLPIPQPVHNVDGTANKNGMITDICYLLVSKGNIKERVPFYVTDLGKDPFIFGYPWCQDFKPEIDWENSKLKGPKIKVETLLYGKH